MIFIWREKELSIAKIALNKKRNNSVVVVWENWVWKTMLIKELERQQAKYTKVVDWFLFKEVQKVDLEKLWTERYLVWVSTQEYLKILDFDSWFFKEFEIRKVR